MHICPQEIMAFMMAYDMLKPYVGIVKIWCQSCFNGTHKSCEDHSHGVDCDVDVEENFCEHVIDERL